MRSDLRHYLGRFRGKTRLHGRRDDQPYWLLLPLWLAEAFRGKQGLRTAGGGFVRDIIWAQYCLFVVIRIQDDIFDRHMACSSLIYAADGFRIEAERVFSKYFRRTSQFWNIYASCMRETVFAVVEADRLQQSAGKEDRRLLRENGRTSAILTVASAAVCLKANRMKDFSRVVVFAREMMMAGSLIDDLLDMAEDIGRGRFNHAASFFLHGAVRSPDKRVLQKIARALLFTDGLTRFFREINRHVAVAEKALEPIMSPAAKGYLSSYRRSLERFEDGIHRTRVGRIFGCKIRKGST